MRKFFRASTSWEVGDKRVGNRTCRACVIVRACTRALIFSLGLICIIPRLLCAGLSVFSAMFPVTTLVSGRRWRCWLRPWVAYIRWWESFSFYHYAAFIGGLIDTCFRKLGDWTLESRGCQRTACECVCKQCHLSPAVRAAIKYFVQWFVFHHIGGYHLFNLYGAFFNPHSTPGAPAIKRFERGFSAAFCLP